MAWRFDLGTTEHLRRSAALPDEANVTIAGWVRRASGTAAWQGIFTLEPTGGAQWWGVGFDASNNLGLAVSGSGSDASPSAIPVDTWIFVAIVGDGANPVLVYWREASQTAFNTPLTVSASGITVDHMTFGATEVGEMLDGRMAGIKVWDAALTATELLAESRQIAPVRRTNVHGWWPGKLHTDLADGSGNGKTLTATGTLTTEAGPPVPFVENVEVLQASGATTSQNATATRAFSNNVQLGSLIVVVDPRFNAEGSDPFVAGDCTKSAGTATLSTIQLDHAHEQDTDLPTNQDRVQVGIWSAIVTGAGSLTMQIASGGSGLLQYHNTAILEVAGTWKPGRVRAVNAAGSTTDFQTAGNTGNVTTAKEGGLLVAGLSIGTSANPANITPDAAFTTVYEEEDGTTNHVSSVIRRIVTALTTDEGAWTFSGSTTKGWNAAIVAYQHGEFYKDTFNRANGDIDASTSSDGEFVWDETIGTEWEVVSNRAAAVNIADGAFSVAVAQSPTVSDNQWAEATITGYTRASASVLNFEIGLRCNAAGTQGFGFCIGLDDSNVSTARIYRMDTDATLLTGDVDPSGGGTLRVEAEGDDLRAYWNGTLVMSTTSTLFKGESNRLASINSYSDFTGGSNDLEVEDFYYGDLPLASFAAPPITDGPPQHVICSPMRW